MHAQAVTLRRVKTEQYNGRPMVTLPPSTVSVDHLVFSPEEEAIYSAYEAQTQVCTTHALSQQQSCAELTS